jgi:hypothetical protein
LAISKTGVSESLSATAITDTTTWHHVAFTYDNSTIKFYLDGSLLTSNGYGSQNYSFSGYPVICNNVGNMKLCDMRFYNVVLNSTQIGNLHSGTNTDGSSVTTTSGYVSLIDSTLLNAVQTNYGDTSSANQDTKITFTPRNSGGQYLVGVML